MPIDIGTYAIKDDLTAQFAKMAAAATSFDKALGNTRGAKRMSDSLDALAKDALKPLREMAKAQEKAAKEAAKRERDAQRQMRAEQAAAAAFVRGEQRKQAEIERTRRAQEKAAANTTWGRAKSAFGEAVSPRQMAIGAARTIGAGMISAPFAAIGAGFSLVEGIADKVVGVGKDLVGAVIDAAQFRQNAITGLEYMLGTREEAMKIFKEAQDLAAETPLDTDKVITGIKQLVTAGFSGKESMVLFKSVADQAAKFADDEGMQDKVIAAFSRIKGRGVASGEDLESLRVAGFRSESIVEQLLLNPKLAPLFKGTKGKDKEAVMKQVKEVLGQGKIGVYTLLNAAIASQETGKLEIGEFAKRMDKVSLIVPVSDFKSAFGELLKSVDLDKWAGISGEGAMAGGKGGLQGFLTRINDALKGDVGKQLLGTIEKIINTLLGGLDKIGASDIDGFVKRIASLGEAAVDVIKKAWEWLDKLLHSEPGALIDSLADVLVDVGALIGEGVLKGFKAAASGGSMADERFIKRYGVSRGHAEAQAAKMGVSSKDFLNMYAGAEKQFKADEMVGTVFTQGGESAGEAYMRRVLEYNAMLTEQTRGKESFDVGSPAIKSLNIPALGVGGIVTGPTLAWVGESGPEAVVPLRTMSSASEASVSRFDEFGATAATTGSSSRGMGGIGTLNLNVNVGSVSGGDVTATANAIADVTIERLTLALMERKRDEG